MEGFLALYVILIVIVFVTGIYDAFKIGKGRRYRNRVWCTCQVNDRIGLVPLDVYDRASRTYWRSLRKCLNQLSLLFPTLIYPPESEIIVVLRADLDRITERRHFLERRVFFVPKQLTPFYEAHKRMNGHPPKQ